MCRSFFIGNSVGELARFDTRTGEMVVDSCCVSVCVIACHLDIVVSAVLFSILMNTQKCCTMIYLGGVVNQYKGFAGAVKCIQCYSDDSGDSQIAACGLDRYLRVYSVTPAKLIRQVRTHTHTHTL